MESCFQDGACSVCFLLQKQDQGQEEKKKKKKELRDLQDENKERD